MSGSMYMEDGVRKALSDILYELVHGDDDISKEVAIDMVRKLLNPEEDEV